MSAKISALPNLVPITNTDLMTCVVGGANSRNTRPEFLTFDAGEQCIISANGGTFTIDAVGGTEIALPIGGLFSLIAAPVGQLLAIEAVGGVAIGDGTLVVQLLGPLASNLTLDALGGATLLCTPGLSCFVTYFPAAPANWIGNPLDLATAVDRLAAVVAVLFGGPIP